MASISAIYLWNTKSPVSFPKLCVEYYQDDQGAGRKAIGDGHSGSRRSPAAHERRLLPLRHAEARLLDGGISHEHLFIARVNFQDLHAGFLGAGDHVAGADATGEGNDEVGLGFIQHLLVANWPCHLAVLISVERKLAAMTIADFPNRTPMISATVLAEKFSRLNTKPTKFLLYDQNEEAFDIPAPLG